MVLLEDKPITPNVQDLQVLMTPELCALLGQNPAELMTVNTYVKEDSHRAFNAWWRLEYAVLSLLSPEGKKRPYFAWRIARASLQRPGDFDQDFTWAEKRLDKAITHYLDVHCKTLLWRLPRALLQEYYDMVFLDKVGTFVCHAHKLVLRMFDPGLDAYDTVKQLPLSYMAVMTLAMIIYSKEIEKVTVDVLEELLCYAQALPSERLFSCVEMLCLAVGGEDVLALAQKRGLEWLSKVVKFTVAKPVTDAAPTTPKQAAEKVIKQQQERLFILRHASQCPGSCAIPLCEKAKTLWLHVSMCTSSTCANESCLSARHLLSHYHKCVDTACQICKLAREEKEKMQGVIVIDD